MLNRTKSHSVDSLLIDLNRDSKLTMQAPAFAVPKLWGDVNADDKESATELQGLSQSGITANTLGVAFKTTACGQVQTNEPQDGTGRRCGQQCARQQ
jgi:hypothetical protein